MQPILNRSSFNLSTWAGADNARDEGDKDGFFHALNQTTSCLGSWRTHRDVISLELSAAGQLVAYSSSGKVKPISEMWISGIPEGLKQHPEELKKYLSKTYVHLGSLGQSEAKLYIHPKLKGGMLAVAAAGLSAVSSTMGFFTSGNYVRLAAETGRQAQATLRVAGNECRATIQTAEDSVANTINRAGAAVSQSINTAKNATTQVLRTARQEIDGVVVGIGIEARHTARVMELQVEKALREAGRTADTTFARAGMEARLTIQSAGQEARDTTAVVSQEVSANITHAREETSRLVTECSREAQTILERTRQEALGVIQEGGADVQQRVNQIIDQAIQELEGSATRTIEVASREIQTLVRSIVTDINATILNAGEQGRLIISHAGNEFQYRATNVLAAAGQEVQVVMREAGVQGSLMIRETGQMIRCTLDRLPTIGARTARLMGRNFVVGIRQGLVGVSQVDQIVNSIMDYCDTRSADEVEGPEKSLQHLIEYIVEQHQLQNPRHKALLYRTLVNVINHPEIPQKVRKASYLLIGASACRDDDLIESRGFCRFIFVSRHLSDQVIDAVPGKAQGILRRLRENAMDYYIRPEPLPQVDLINPVAVAAEQRAQEERETGLAHANELANLQLRIDQMQLSAEIAAAQIAELQQQLAVQPEVGVEAIRIQIAQQFEGQLEEQTRLIGQLRREIEYLSNRQA